MNPEPRRNAVLLLERAPVQLAALSLVIAALSLAACGELEESESTYPVQLEPVAGTDAKRVTFLPEGARRVGLQTAEVGRKGGLKVIPYAALIYDADGKAFVYTSPKPLTYLRQEVEIDRVEGSRVWLSAGPPAGTKVVTTGAAEVYGSEFEVDH
jgi:hypothetical protein